MERTKNNRNLTVGVALVLVALIALVGVFATIGLNQSAESASATGTVNFVQVTDASQITEANIGECTFDEAKQWIIANWDDVFDGVAGNTFVDFVYVVGVELHAISFTQNEYSKTAFESGFYTDQSVNIEWIKGYYSNNGDIVYLCDPNSVSGGSGGQDPQSSDTFVKVTNADQGKHHHQDKGNAQGEISIFSLIHNSFPPLFIL